MNRTEQKILCILGIVILVVYGITGFYSHPSADDFSYATLGQNEDFLLTVLNERQTWNGRYFSNFLVLFSPLNWGGISGYKLMPLLLICLIVFGTSYFFKTVLGNKHLLLSLSVTIITFSIMPDITEGIYWYTGAWTYIPSAVLFLIGLALVIKNRNAFGIRHYILVGSIFIISSGFNEIIPLLGITTFIICLVMKNRKLHYLVFLVLFTTLLLYILTAPGNLIRGSYFPNKNQLLKSLYLSTLYSGRFIGEWMLNPVIILWGLILLKINFNTTRVVNLQFLRNPLIIIIALVAPIYICCFGPLWSTGSLSQLRTANLACYLFLPVFSLGVVANKDFLIKRLRFLMRFKYTFVVFILFFALWKNQFFLYKELITGELAQFNIEMNDRYNIINRCNEPDCYVPEVKNKTKTLFVRSLNDDPNYWLNEAYQNYFKSGKIHKIKN